jgi:hypothetical protein
MYNAISVDYVGFSIPCQPPIAASCPADLNFPWPNAAMGFQS